MPHEKEAEEPEIDNHEEWAPCHSGHMSHLRHQDVHIPPELTRDYNQSIGPESLPTVDNLRWLMAELRRIRQLDREWSMALIGVGRLGRAILNFGGFSPQGFKIVAAFDTDPAQVGKKVGNLTVRMCALP